MLRRDGIGPMVMGAIVVIYVVSFVVAYTVLSAIAQEDIGA